MSLRRQRPRPSHARTPVQTPWPWQRNRTAAAAFGAALALTLTVAGCSSSAPNSVTAQARSGDRKGYISGDGTIEQIPDQQRGEPLALTGTTLEGQPWSSTDAAVTGKVLVLNVWGSWCPPCISEADDLQAAWADVSKRKLPVAFLGLDKQESPATGLAFQTEQRITYPSLAYDGGVPILALRGKAVATPTTLVLDAQHRIAARVSGPVDTKTLLGLIEDTLTPTGTRTGTEPGTDTDTGTGRPPATAPATTMPTTGATTTTAANP